MPLRSALPLALLLGCAPNLADWSVNPGVEIATVTGAEPGEPLTLYDDDDNVLLTILADDLGQAHFAYIPAEPLELDSRLGVLFPVIDGSVLLPGTYRILNDETGLQSGRFDVLHVDDTPDPELYDRQAFEGVRTVVTGGFDAGELPEDGFHYIEMRDGTLLSAMIRYPDPALYGYGPYPTVVEYSGYSPSRPDDGGAGQMIANVLGYATVGVNMRGTGCSGGVFDVFNPAQHADGYDIIEAVARQPWVMDHRVGMVGLSYPGISQLYVASTAPPSLAAIVPLSTIADAWEMQWPGGVYNDGFTRQWIANRDSDAKAGGTTWVSERIDNGDTTCEANLRLSSQNIDFATFLHGMEDRPVHANARDLTRLVRKIEAPVFLAGGFQDEQTGSLFASMLDHFDNTVARRFTLYNGRHPDGFTPAVVYRWYEFLEFYLARRVPRMNAVLRLVGAEEFGKQFGAQGLAFEPDRFDDFGDDEFDAALAAYEAEPEVRVLFEVGGGDPTQPGSPIARGEATYDTWPAPTAGQRQWFLDAGGALSETAGDEGADLWRFDPEAGGDTFFGEKGYQLMVPLWDIDWKPFAEGDVASYRTAPFAADEMIAGPAVADLWIRSAEPDVTVQVTLTEVRPDGNEVLIQSGWLRLGHRAGTVGDDLRLVRSYAIDDYEPVPVDTWVQASVALTSFAHPIRAGSSLRVAVSSPGRNHGTWEFEAPDYDGTPAFELGRGGAHASALTLGTLPDLAIPEGLAACPSLRGQPCRPFTPVANVEAP